MKTDAIKAENPPGILQIIPYKEPGGIYAAGHCIIRKQ